jgi:hypothetical protein
MTPNDLPQQTAGMLPFRIVLLPRLPSFTFGE